MQYLKTIGKLEWILRTNEVKWSKSLQKLTEAQILGIISFVRNIHPSLPIVFMYFTEHKSEAIVPITNVNTIGEPKNKYRKTFNIRRTLIGYKLVDHSDVVGESPVGAAPTTSIFST